jgi:alpha-beta hydrolase superfamily lysophospholipase
VPFLRHLLSRTAHWVLVAILAVALVVVLVATGFGVRSRSLPDLAPWHTEAPGAELAADDIGRDFTLTQYLAREDAVMRDVRDRIETATPDDQVSPYNRYDPSSPINPRHLPRDWNRTFEVQPSVVTGGALLVHGMTDSPYSMRASAFALQDAGYYGLALRMPGHGTVPAGLARARWEDWATALDMGMRQVRQTIGPNRPLVLVGYSNGGALAVLYALRALDDAALPRPDRIVLLSPMVGVTPIAALSPVSSLLSGLPWFNKAAWTDIQPEYNPFKYTSFPANAAYQSYRLTRELDRRLLRAQQMGRLGELPPILTFQSLVDATVLPAALVDRLYGRLPPNGSALVMFDVNRLSPARVFMHRDVDALLARLLAARDRTYRLTVVTNASPDSGDVVARSYDPAGGAPDDESLGLTWPSLVFSLSHVAIPFPPDDPLYGIAPDERENYGVQLGHLDPRGERGVLLVSVDDLMRLTSNPFYPYLDRRLKEWVQPVAGR